MALPSLAAGSGPRSSDLPSCLEAYFAKWEESVCHHCDEGLAEFVDELREFRDQSCQAGESCLTSEALQAASKEVRRRAEGRSSVVEPGTTAPNPKIRAAIECS